MQGYVSVSRDFVPRARRVDGWKLELVRSVERAGVDSRALKVTSG